MYCFVIIIVSFLLKLIFLSSEKAVMAFLRGLIMYVYDKLHHDLNNEMSFDVM